MAGKRQSYNFTNVKPSGIINIEGWIPNTISIANNCRFACYVNIGTNEIPTSTNFSDVIAPFSNYNTDPVGAVNFAVNVDNSSAPSEAFKFPVVVVATTGLGTDQGALNLS